MPGTFVSLLWVISNMIGVAQRLLESGHRGVVWEAVGSAGGGAAEDVAAGGGAAGDGAAGGDDGVVVKK